MRKFLHIFITNLLLISVGFAYVPNQTAINENQIYCPSQVTCSKSNDINSCNYKDKDLQYWQIKLNTGEPVIQGTYKLNQILGSYHTSNRAYAECAYFNNETGTPSNIALWSKVDDNPEAFYDKTLKWMIRRDFAECNGTDVESCPFEEQSALGIFNNNTINLLVTENNVRLSEKTIPSNRHMVVSYEDALNGCGNSKECRLDITTDSNVAIGSITVDMDNKMKILKINPINFANIKQIKPYNTVEIDTNNLPPPVNSLIEINNHINSDILALAGSNPVIDKSIESGGHAEISADRASIACQSIKECQIDLTTSKGGLLGSIVLDIDNQMSITQVISFRPSQIIVIQTSFNTVEVSYPNKK